MFFHQKPKSIVEFQIKDYRKYGQPKLKKPTELRGIKQEFSIHYNPKCRCQVFYKGKDVWIKHRDYFSPSLCQPEDYGKSLNELCEKYMGKTRPQKFVYADAWGDLVARSEAWIRLKNVLVDVENKVFPLDIVYRILRQQEQTHGTEEYDMELYHQYMVRFWESVVMELVR